MFESAEIPRRGEPLVQLGRYIFRPSEISAIDLGVKNAHMPVECKVYLRSGQMLYLDSEHTAVLMAFLKSQMLDLTPKPAEKVVANV